MSTTTTSHLNRSFGQSSRASSSTQPYEQATAGTQKFVIGKIDAGIAVLISDSVHLIEFPSLLLPSGVGPGSIVNIACSRNFQAERSAAKEFWDLQKEISQLYGNYEPLPPRLRIRNTTQTSVTLEWDKLELASSNLLSLSIYRNQQRLTTIPSPLTNTSTKLSGLQLDTDYTFHLVLKTSAGTLTSNQVKTKTHTIDNTSGISVCFGFVEPKELLQQAKEAIKEMGCKWDEKIQIDTTHFVATSNKSTTSNDGPGVEYQKAIQLSIPVVSPEWLLSCNRSSKMVPISAFYLGQTNHAASLSSAQLVSSNPSSSSSSSSSSTSRQITSSTTTTTNPTTTTKSVVTEVVPEEEEESIVPPPPQVEVNNNQQKGTVELEENVEGPPEEQREELLQQSQPEPQPEQVVIEPSAAAEKEEEPEQEEEKIDETDNNNGSVTKEEEEENNKREGSLKGEEGEKPSSGVPQPAKIVSTESESAHELDPEVKKDLDKKEEEEEEDEKNKIDLINVEHEQEQTIREEQQEVSKEEQEQEQEQKEEQKELEEDKREESVKDEEEEEKPTSGVPQPAKIVSTESESAHELDPEVKKDLDKKEEEDKTEGIETPKSEAQESVDLDDAFEDTEENVLDEKVADEEKVEEEREDEGEGEKSLVDIEL